MNHYSNEIHFEYYTGRAAYLYTLGILTRWVAGDLILDRNTALLLEGFKCAHEAIERGGVKICDD